MWDIADTLDVYIDKYSSLVSYLADNSTAGAVSPSDLASPNLTSDAMPCACVVLSQIRSYWHQSLIVQTGVVFHSPDISRNFEDKPV
jgi:neutral ceramidase